MACSFITAIIAAPPKIVTGIVLNYSSVAIFFSYAVLFAIPLVQVHEKADKFALHLYELRMDAESQTSAQNMILKNGQNLIAIVDLLEEKARHYVLYFTGGSLIHYSRGLLAAACTFLVSGGLLALEVVSRAEPSSPQLLDCSICGIGNGTRLIARS
ncbi:uncharacterized protein LOC129594952 [Paramacrobiotus metropolitanus]|uniref:uncharacterized protein LOC129594952 n=1 Tax=Paramacrobiotus metropolitanus TaxID=2943436 RepID=UPI0024463D7D|nr:uncharacterized protein LOC129594952 [Paramacrobiotus metropolitanus]